MSCKYCEELHDLCYNQHFCICRIFFIHAGISIHVPSALSKNSLNAVLKGNSGVFFLKPRPYIYMSWCENYTDSPMFFGGWDSERLTKLRKGFLWWWTFFFCWIKRSFLSRWMRSLALKSRKDWVVAGSRRWECEWELEREFNFKVTAKYLIDSDNLNEAFQSAIFSRMRQKRS